MVCTSVGSRIKPLLDVKTIVRNASAVRDNAVRRRVTVDVDALQTMYRNHTEVTQRIQSLRQERNSIAAAVKKASPADRQLLVQDGKALKAELSTLEASEGSISENLMREALRVPNDTHPDVADEEVCIGTIGKHPGPTLPCGSLFEGHEKIGQHLGLFDFEVSALTSALVNHCKAYIQCLLLHTNPVCRQQLVLVGRSSHTSSELLRC